MTLLLPAFTGAPAVNRVYNCDAMTLLKAMPSNSVDMVLTSPPYDNLRTYNGYSFEFEPIARETYRVLKPGGVCVWVVGDSTINGSETLTSMRQALYFVDVCGFRMHDTMIWDKGSVTFPDINRYYQSWEYMFVFSKGQPKTANLQTQPNKWAGNKIHGRKRLNGNDLERNPRSAGREVKLDGILRNVWLMSPGWGKSTMDKVAFEHPAIFPEELAELHIKSWTNPGDLVLDPFMGSGTVAKEARKLNRNWLGSEISAKYIKIYNDRMRMPFEEKQVKHETKIDDLPLWAPVPQQVTVSPESKQRLIAEYGLTEKDFVTS